MDATGSAVIVWLRELLDALLCCGAPDLDSIPAVDEAVEPEAAALVERAVLFASQWRDFQEFSTAVAHGDLSATSPRRNQLAAPMKALQASLRHLTWQTQQVAAGDLSQQMDFMGDFSRSFNSLIDSLRVKEELERELKESHAELDRRVVERTAELKERNEQLLQEIDERRKTELELRNARRLAEQASRAKSEFLTNMSHELRTPLGGVLGLARILSESPLTDEQLDLVNDILKSGEQQLLVVNDILDYSSLQEGQSTVDGKPFRLAAPIKAAMDMVRHAAECKGLSLVARISEDLPKRVVGDPARVSQILYNLLDNAIKYTPKGSVTLTVSRPDGDGEAPPIRIVVADTGPGIPADRRVDVFDTFTQLDGSLARTHGGAGLGLSICRRLVELMGGSIRVDAAPGGGASFSCELPLPGADAPDAEDVVTECATERATDAGPAAEGLQVLVVEDNVVNQKVACVILGKLGCEVTLANHGQEALSLLAERAFDLIFMDCQMPVMDGFAATTAIRAMGGECTRIPIVALTAHFLPEDRERCLEAGMDDYVVKPVKSDVMAEILRQWTCRNASPCG